MVAPVLVFAVGNESRGDDALAPLLLRELDVWLMANGCSDQVELLEEFQLQIENALDMKDRRLVLFVDAGMDTSDPYSFQRVQKNDAPVLYSHALEPQALLRVYEEFYQEMPPDVFVLCVRGERFELGEGLSLQAVERRAAAFELCKKLLHDPDVEAWDEACEPKTVAQSIGCEDNRHEQARC